MEETKKDKLTKVGARNGAIYTLEKDAAGMFRRQSLPGDKVAGIIHIDAESHQRTVGMEDWYGYRVAKSIFNALNGMRII